VQRSWVNSMSDVFYHRSPDPGDKPDPGVDDSDHHWWHWFWTREQSYTLFTSPFTSEKGKETYCKYCNKVVRRYYVSLRW